MNTSLKAASVRLNEPLVLVGALTVLGVLFHETQDATGLWMVAGIASGYSLSGST